VFVSYKPSLTQNLSNIIEKFFNWAWTYCIPFFSGGMFFLSRKHKDGKRVKYNSGFYITTNTFPDFGGPATDNEAIKKRLAIFHTNSLKKRSASVARK